MVISALLPLILMVSCKKAPEKVVVTETRELTMWDQPRLPLIAVMPPEWRQIPGTQHRVLNYRFGESGEVYMSNARGGALPNVNRWLGQFGKDALANLDGLPKVNVLGQQGFLVEATGRFGGGMGKAPREDAALLGVVVDFGSNLFTVKMLGSVEEVNAERERLINYCEQLRYHDAEASESE